MWFLTHEGIDRYNGKQYTHYSLTANGKLLNFFPNLNTLQSNILLSLESRNEAVSGSPLLLLSLLAKSQTSSNLSCKELYLNR